MPPGYTARPQARLLDQFLAQHPDARVQQLGHDRLGEFGVSLDSEHVDRRQSNTRRRVRFEVRCRRGVEYHHALVGRDVRRTEEMCVGRGRRDVVPVHLLDVLCTASRGRSFYFEREGVGTHELVRAKDGFAEGGELDGGHGHFPDAVVLRAGPAKGPCNDLVAKADARMRLEMSGGMGRAGVSLTEYLQGRFLGNDARDVCDQLVDPLDVFVGRCACDKNQGHDKGDWGTTNESR